MNDPVFWGLSVGAWTALATVVMAFTAAGSLWVSVLLMQSQARVLDMQNRLIELQSRANWLSGALESHSELNLRLNAEQHGKGVVWWDPTHDGPEKKRPLSTPVHGESATLGTVYVYVPQENRRYPDIG